MTVAVPKKEKTLIFLRATAYIGVVKKLNVQPGKTIVINAASGAGGQVAGQITKIKVVYTY